MANQLIIIGVSTTAKQVYDFVVEYDLFEVKGFAVNAQYKTSDFFCGLPVYDIEELKQVYDIDRIYIFVAILWNRLNKDRRNVYEKLKKRGFRFANLVSPSARIRGKLSGDNCWIHDYVVVQSDAEIKEDCMLMAFSLIGAFSKMEAHCFMGTKSTIAGNCHIGEQTFIGMNCTIFDDTTIGKKCLLGACTAVKRNTEDCTIVKIDEKNTITKKLNAELIEQKLIFFKNIR